MQRQILQIQNAEAAHSDNGLVRCKPGATRIEAHGQQLAPLRAAGIEHGRAELPHQQQVANYANACSAPTIPAMSKRESQHLDAGLLSLL